MPHSISAREQAQRAEPRAFSVDEWCELRRISKPLFYKLLGQGKAPATYRAGARRFVSDEADRAWQAAMEAKEAAA
jgi:predicted DNA-binding transcriptional regulator AlpA